MATFRDERRRRARLPGCQKVVQGLLHRSLGREPVPGPALHRKLLGGVVALLPLTVEEAPEEVVVAIGQQIAQDPAFEDSIMVAPSLKFVDDPDELGNIAIMRGRVEASDRWDVATEIRLRLDHAFVSEGIVLNRFGAVPGASRPSVTTSNERTAS